MSLQFEAREEIIISIVYTILIIINLIVSNKIIEKIFNDKNCKRKIAKDTNILITQFVLIILGNIIVNNILIRVLVVLSGIALYSRVLKLTLKNTIEFENLRETNERLQNNYDSVRAFRHDFNNIMQGIGGYIALNDMDGLKAMYSSIIDECQEVSESQAINEDIINNPAIYNLINNKIRTAKKDGVKLKINVYIDLNTLNISSYDLCRMLGILIDNAVEAAKVCEDKTVYIKFIKDKLNNRNLVIVENPYKNYLIDIKKIYEKGFSSKKDKVSHGLGLWKVKQILRKNKNINIYTSRDKLFKQQLEIY